jgi:serine/threonine protein kinase/tetratricopeptide (TPR) repeat protein
VTLEQTFGRYRLLSRLGEGGMAEVFKAKSFGVEGFEKVLVIKRILPALAAHPKFVDMFVHEAKLAVRLSHANIVQVFDLGRVDHPTGEPTSYFIAMEYVPGLDLATLLARCRRLKVQIPFGMAVFLAAEVAKALEHAHRRRDEHARPLGIVHRDISPQNILLSWEGEVKVTDFGIAKAKDSIASEEAEDDARNGRVRGKLAYMSPEQSRALPVDGRSDLFSLGTVLYELIAGSNPFSAPTAFETLRRVQASEYPPLELLRPDTPRSLVEIVGKMLDKKADERFSDAGKLHEQLLGFFFSSGERFGPSRLAEFLERFHESQGEAQRAPEIEGGAVFSDEQTGANDRTPVEVPNPNPTGAVKSVPGGLFKTGERPVTGQLTRTSEIGERREVTALVLSFPAADRGPASADAPLIIARICDVVARYGAAIIEQDPSQIVALFGLGDADGRDTESAVRAALVILRGRGGGLISAGIHVARILVELSGQPVKDERLTSLVASAQSLARATEGQVALSRIAARIIRAEFSTDELPGAGRSAPEGGRVITSARSPSSVYGRFVGRHDELKRLGDILATATRRKVQLISVQGDKGVGKTRLLAEMERRLSKGNYNVGFYVAACPRNGAEIPLSGLSSMLRVLCGIQEGDDEARILEVLPRLRALGLQSDESSAVLAELGASLSDKPPQESSAALRSGFARMVQSLSDDRLHCFSWDDAHALDKATLDTILAIAGRGAATPVPDPGRASLFPPSAEGARPSMIPPASTSSLRAVFLFATRDELPEALLRNPAHHLLALGDLSDDDSARLIATRVGARVLAPDLLAFCRERAGGHPLFLEELIRELSDSGAINVVSGEARVKLEGGTTVPRTLRTLIAGRVSRLDTAERAVLQASAILGEPILTQVLATLLKQSVSQIDRAVAGLVAKDFLHATGPAQVSFASPIHGEIVLDAIPPEARRELHAASASAFIAVFGEDGLDHGERIGLHLYEAGDRDRAAGFFAEAALHRMKSGQLEPAIRLLGRALDLAELEQRTPAELALWLSALSDVVARVRAAPDLPAISARALRRIDAVGSIDEKILSRVDTARALAAVNHFDDAYRLLEEAFSLAGDDAHLRSRALVVELESASRSGDFARGLRAVDKLEALGPLRNARVLLSASYVRAASGDCASALRAIDEAESIDRPDDLMAAVEREKQRVLVYIYMRDFQAAVEASGRAVDLARSAGVRYATAVALHNLGDAARRLGDLPRAYAALSESRDICEAGGQERLAAQNRMHLAYLDGMSGVEGSAELLHDLVRYADSRGYFLDALEGQVLLGSLLKHQGDPSARRELEQVLQKAIELENQLVAEEAREALARA